MTVTSPPTRVRRRFGVAEAVADQLRQRILSGDDYADGMLPKLEDLTEEFRVSTAAMREACRILQTEGLISVVRGNTGGAIVHRPSADNVAYTVGLVLQARGVMMPDVARAIERFEPLGAELCAEREDREQAVLPALEAAQRELEDCVKLGHGEAASGAARRWHEVLVESCGNETVEVLLGALLATFRAHVTAEAAEFRARGIELSPELAKRTIDEHNHIQELIRIGDGPGAMAAARAHLRTARIHPSDHSEYTSVVRAEAIRDRLSG
ncbi:MAG: FCD domain-containing protein [Ilumatobacteraceae bacterium]